MEKNFTDYDILVSKTATNFLSYSKRHNNEIRIGNFDPKNINYLFVFEVARIVSQISDAKVVIEYPWYKKILHKSFRKVKSHSKVEDGINVDEFLDFTFEGYDITPTEIYEEYYK